MIRDTQPKSLRVTMRVQNNALYARRVERGLSQRELSAIIGTHVANYGPLENLRASPLSAKGEIRGVAKKLMEFYDCAFEELWPDVVLQVATPVATREMDAEELALLLPKQETPLLPSPAELYDRKEDLDRVMEAMKHLREREREVLESYFLNDMPDKELAEKYGVSTSRIHQMRQSAIRKVQVIIRDREKVVPAPEQAEPKQAEPTQRELARGYSLIHLIVQCLMHARESFSDMLVSKWSSGPGLTTREIADTIGAGVTHTRRVLRLMRDRGQVYQGMYGRWELQDSSGFSCPDSLVKRT